MPALLRRLAERGIVSKRRIDRLGRVTGGGPFSRGALYALLRNPLYAGKARHKGSVYDGQHEAIIDLAIWQAAQDLLGGNGGGPIVVKRKHARRWLDGVFIERASKLAARLGSAADDGAGPLRAPILMRLDLEPGLLKAQVNLGGLVDGPGDREDLVTSLDIPFTLHQNGKARPIVVRTASEPQRDPDLIALLADARRGRDDLFVGRAASIEELTTREGLSKGAISRVLPPAWLAPDISAAILDGRQPPDLTPARLRNLPELPLDWVDQRALLGFPAI